jgi:hypothetical protein
LLVVSHPFGDKGEAEDDDELQGDIEPESAQHRIGRLFLEPSREARQIDHDGRRRKYLLADRLGALGD